MEQNANDEDSTRTKMFMPKKAFLSRMQSNTDLESVSGSSCSPGTSTVDLLALGLNPRRHRDDSISQISLPDDLRISFSEIDDGSIPLEDIDFSCAASPSVDLISGNIVAMDQSKDAVRDKDLQKITSAISSTSETRDGGLFSTRDYNNSESYGRDSMKNRPGLNSYQDIKASDRFLYKQSENNRKNAQVTNSDSARTSTSSEECLDRTGNKRGWETVSRPTWESLTKPEAPQVSTVGSSGEVLSKKKMVSPRRSSKNKHMENKLCQVCGDVAAGFYCGAYICEACKKFYMRAYKQDKLKYVCLRDKNCVITKESRVQCQYCRFQKCVSLNMYCPKQGEDHSNKDMNMADIPCRVCSAPSSGFHFGAITCEGCKGFFRRMAKEREPEKYQCNKSGKCEINMITRNLCKACRYKQCLSAGMSVEGSRIGRQPNSVKHAISMELKHHVKPDTDKPEPNLGDNSIQIKQEPIDESEADMTEMKADDLSFWDEFVTSDYPLQSDKGPKQAPQTAVDAYSTPSSPYNNTPSSSFNTLSNLDSSSYNTPSNTDNTPANSYNTTSSTPSSPYSVPSSPYSLPSTSYNTTSTSYNTPLTSYNTPLTSYNTPSTSYNTPSTTFNTPSTSNNMPSTSYNTPSTTFNTPSSSYSTPSSSNTNSKSSYMLNRPFSKNTESFLFTNLSDSFDSKSSPPSPSADSWMTGSFPRQAAKSGDQKSHSPSKPQPQSKPLKQPQKPPPPRAHAQPCRSTSVQPQAQVQLFRPPAAAATYQDGDPGELSPVSASPPWGKSEDGRDREGEGVKKPHGGHEADEEMDDFLAKIVEAGKVLQLLNYRVFDADINPTTSMNVEDIKSLFKSKYMDPRMGNHITSNVDMSIFSTKESTWNYMMTNFHHNTYITIRFAKMVPGFKSLLLNDQVKLIQYSIYPIELLNMSKVFDPATKQYNYFTYTKEEENIMMEQFPMLNVLKDHLVHIGEMVTSFEFTDEEFALLSALLLFPAEIHGLENPKAVDELQNKISSALQYYEEKMHPDGLARYGILLVRVAELVQCLLQHNLAIGLLLTHNPSIQVPQLFHELIIESIKEGQKS